MIIPVQYIMYRPRMLKNLTLKSCLLRLTIWLEMDWSGEVGCLTSRLWGTPRTTPMLSPLLTSLAPPQPLNVRDFLMSLLRSGGWSLGLGGGDVEPFPDNGLGRWLLLPDLCRMNCTSFEYSPHFVNTCNKHRKFCILNRMELLINMVKTNKKTFLR